MFLLFHNNHWRKENTFFQKRKPGKPGPVCRDIAGHHLYIRAQIHRDTGRHRLRDGPPDIRPVLYPVSGQMYGIRTDIWLNILFTFAYVFLMYIRMYSRILHSVSGIDKNSPGYPVSDQAPRPDILPIIYIYVAYRVGSLSAISNHSPEWYCPFPIGYEKMENKSLFF